MNTILISEYRGKSQAALRLEFNRIELNLLEKGKRPKIYWKRPLVADIIYTGRKATPKWYDEGRWS